MKKLMYILLFLLIAANVAAQESYVIDGVCTGADRFYRVDTKERGSTWEWHIKDTLGNEIANPAYTDFWIESSPGDTTWGSEINYTWNDIGVFLVSTLHYSEHGCDTLEQGIVNVYEAPGAVAGNDMIICADATVTLSTDTAWAYSSMVWTTTGDGTFSNETAIHPTYFPGTTDILSGTVTLILTANGLIASATCEPAVDSMKIRLSNPAIAMSKNDLLCYNDSSGWISATVSGGIEPYIYSWTGPGTFTASGDSIFGLAAGKYLLLVTDSIGCMVSDSVEITEPLELLVIVAADTTEMCDDGIISLNATASGGTGSYTHLWTGSGAVYLDATDTMSVFFQGAIAGIYTLIYNVTDENGCIAADTVEVTVLPKDTIVVDTVICGLDAPFAWLGETYFVSGQYTDTLESLIACDTIMILNLTVLPIDTIKVDTIICISDTPFAWYGKDYFTTGIYTDMLSPLIGCDTILVLDLTVLPIDTISVDTIICGLDAPFAWYGKDYFFTGIYTDTLPATVGCDTILILDLTVLPIDTLKLDTVICGNQVPFAFNGNDYFITGTYFDTILAATGCDTIAILNLIVLPVDTLVTDTVVCGNEVPFAWNGADFFISGEYIDTLVSATGCDSILILNLTVLPIDTIKVDTIICISETPFAWYGKDYFTTGIYTDTLSPLIGCDTILVLDLTVLPIDTISVDTIICGLDAPFAWYGKDYFFTGIYTDTLPATVGCDTILILDLTVLPIDTIFIDTVICAINAPFSAHGLNYYTTGIYSNTLISATECDTILIVDLTVLPNDTITFSNIICASETPFNWHGDDYYVTGIYADTLISAFGCDTIAVLDLTVLPIDTITLNTTICADATPFVWYGKNYFITDIYTDTLFSATACDTILILDLTVLPKDTISLDTVICENETPFAWNGKNYFTTDIYIDTLLSPFGCDTISILNLTVLPTDTIRIDTTICESDAPFALNGKNYYNTDIYIETLASATGCDSILILDLKILPNYRNTLSLTVCETELPYTWFGQTFTEADTVIINIPSSTSGCDTILTFELQTVPEILVTEQRTICETELPYTWFGQIFTAADTVVINIPSVTGGCDTILTLNVITLPATLSLTDTTIYMTDLPFVWNGNSYNAGGTYNITLVNTNGCDSLLTLNLTVLTTIPPLTVTIDTAICVQDLPLVWNGKDYSSEGQYRDTLVAISGADSVVTLNLIHIPEIKPTFDQLGPYCLNVVAGPLPLVSKEGITGTWSQTVINTSSLKNQLIIFTPDPGQCAVSTTMEIDVVNNITPAIAGIGPFCENSVAPPLPAVSLNNVTGTWSPSTINTQLVMNRTYTFTPDPGQCSPPVEIDIEILPLVKPAFSPIGPLCQNSTAPALPSVSNNGITGSWYPAVIDTKIDGSFDFIFTPDAGQCAIPDTMAIFISPETTPEFVQIGPLCQNTAPPALPLVSTNGITGTWYPAFIDTKEAGLISYTFTTSSSGQCASATSITIEITPESTPVFAAMGPFCQNSIATALPLVSENGISGKWSPAVINTSVIGFADYTFTPDPGQCAVDTTIRIEITDQIKPVFAAIGPYCQYSIAPALPLVSQNGITGTWLPDTILTTTAGPVSLKFIPDADQCAAEITVNVVILPEVTPVFVQLGPLCQNSTAPALPSVSNNGVTGTWDPAVIDTKDTGTVNYLFTPVAGQCAVPFTMAIFISPEITPEFVQIGPLCQNSTAPALPSVSTNGITGTWYPAVIDTKIDGSFNFIFTPAAGECAIPDTMTIEIIPEITPVFAQLGPLCQNSAAPILPAVSENGITGIWNPAVINTKGKGTFTFIFTPALVHCAVPDTMYIVVTEEITPVFAAFGPVCPFSVAPLLPEVSTNGIKGTWYPAVIETDKLGIFNFTFTPDSGQCAVKVTLEIEISDIIPPVAISRNITVYLDEDGKASITTAQINNGSNDNCELDTLYLSRYDFGCEDVGANPVTLTAVDAVGLIGTTEATVTVLDTIKPVVICRGPFEIQLDENAEYKLTVAEVLDTTYDACGIDTMYLYPHDLNCNHIGLSKIRLMVTDMNGNSSYCETEVMIYGNRPPNVVEDSAFTKENVPVIIDVAENDFDEKTTIDVSSLSISIKPLYGTVSVNPINGDLTYIPSRNFSGVDVLKYRIYDDGIPCEPEYGEAFVYIVVEPVNDKPLAVDDYYDAGCYPVTGNVLDNDSDPDGDPWIVTSPLTPPNHGTLIIDVDGTINYFPNEGYIGIDSFQYVIWDNGIPPLSDTAWVYIEVDCSEETQDPLDCELFIPEGFSPNEDGVHDFFRIMCIHNYPNAKLMIFNRNGDLLWQKQNYGNYDVWGDQYNAWWWGTSVLNRYDVGRQTINGDPKLKVGNYIYVLELGNGERKNGTVMISY